MDSVTRDFAALTSSAGIVHLDDWMLLNLSGPDARSFLQGTASQDLAASSSACAVPSLFLTEKGRAVALAWIGAAGSDQAQIIADGGARATLRPHLERFRIMEDVQFDGPAAGAALAGFAGPGRDSALAEAARTIAEGVPLAAEPISFLVLPSAGSTLGLPEPVAPEAYEAWRITVGLPLCGIDYDLDRIATELALESAISFTKGCYVGQEVVSRTSNRGRVRRRRFGFRFTWAGESIAGRAEIRSGGTAVGFLTSSAPCPGTDQGVGMGYVSVEALENSAPLTVEVSGRDRPIHPAAWPITIPR